MTLEYFDNWYEQIKEEAEEEILTAGYTYRDIEDAKDAILAMTSETEEDARKSLSRFKKEKMAFLFYMVGRLDGLSEGFRKGYNIALGRYE